MVFSSLLFLYVYLPLTMLVLWVLPKKWKNLGLLIASLVFYAWGEPLSIFLMLLSILSAYVFGIWIERTREIAPSRARLLTVLSVSVSLSFLFFFKYYRFFAENLWLLLRIALPVPSTLALPIGISFYTFQILSYTVDLFRGECRAQRDLVAFGCYVTLFPQLVAGPIVRYGEIDRALTHRTTTGEDLEGGILRFCVGLSKKVLLGDRLAEAAVYFLALEQQHSTVVGAWAAAILYALHLYYDFSGYSDMAIGLGRMLGFRFPENFRYPFVARSITEFWRRWHITLSSWFRNYVYIPLGGNRRGRGRQCFNLAVVWLLTGLWHGASWNFVLWGAFFLLLLILEKFFLSKWLSALPPFLGRIYTFGLVTVSFVLFSTPQLSHCLVRLGAMLGIGTAGLTDRLVGYELLHLLPLLFAAFVGATPLPRRLLSTVCHRRPRVASVLPIAASVLLLLSTAYLVDSTFSPFEYTQF